MKRMSLFSAFVLALAVGCGDDGGGSGDYGDPIPNAQAEAAGEQSVEGAAEIADLGSDPANEGALGQAFAVYGNLSTMASTKQSSTAQGILGTGAASVWDPNCVTVDGDTATYSMCDSGGSTIDGTISGNDSSVTIDLAIATTQADIDMEGMLSITDTSLQGNLKYTTTVEASGQTINTVYEGIYDVTATEGCPTGGQVEVHYTATGGAIDVWAKAEFGPACGDVTFY